MNDWTNIFYYSVVSAALVLSALGIWFAAAMPGIDRWSKRFFMGYFAVLVACCVSSLAEMILFMYPIPWAVIYSIVTVECLFLSMPIVLLTVYLLRCCGDDPPSSRLMRAVVGLWGAYFVLLATAPVTGVFAYVPAVRLFTRGRLYPLMLLPLIAIMVLNIAALLRRRTRLSGKVFRGFLAALVPVTAALIAQVFVNVFPLIDISYVASTLVMYSFVLSDQVEQDLRHQREIANQRASIMVLQMRPHFIYNTLTSVYCLCKQDPEQARRVIMDFTTYLRRNFNAIASPEPIPFANELEHTRAYLAVEQAQYEGSLFVDYDTPHTFFRVPPLTLQPIVENAVKHGRDPYAGPFHILIRTRKTDSGSEITVADDGRGFQTADDTGPHIALKNIEARLGMMCGGRLTIAPNDGGGTVVTVTIPDRAAV